MTEIRKYEKSDFENVRYICLNSDGGGLDKELEECILHLFCDYYIENEPNNCFVLSDEGKAVGYVICAESFDEFKPVYYGKYVPLVKGMSEDKFAWANEAYAMHEMFKETYPAHLHIDILPEYQRSGWGGKLINALLNHLKCKGIKGVMLSAGADNKNAGKFYRKHGFEELGTYSTDIAFGIKI